MATIATQLGQQISRLVGTTSPATVRVSDANNVDLSIDFTAVDTMSCSFSEIRLNVPGLQNADIDDLRRWGEQLCSRVTYLLENIGPLEVDKTGNQVLIRSTPPSQQPTGAKFYEIILKSHTSGSFSLRRYESEKGRPGRVQVDIRTTHEVLLKLADDLVDTIP